MVNKELIGSAICTSVAGTSTAIQPNEIFQYIQMGLTIIATIITIILGLRTWWKDAKKDGKITEDEIKEGIDIIQNGVDALQDKKQKEDKEEKK